MGKDFDYNVNHSQTDSPGDTGTRADNDGRLGAADGAASGGGTGRDGLAQVLGGCGSHGGSDGAVVGAAGADDGCAGHTGGAG